MGVLKSQDFDRWVEKNTSSASIILLYGPDEGLVRHRVGLIAKSYLGPASDPLSRIDLDGESIAADPGLLADELNAVSMFSDRRLIVVRQIGRLPKASWTLALETPPESALLILAADDLKKDNALRVACETSRIALAIPCYPLSGAEFGAIIDKRARDAGLTVTPTARASLIEYFGENHGQVEAELEKLFLYAKGSLTIDGDDVEAIIADAATSFGTESIDLAFGGKTEAIDRAVQTAERDGFSGGDLMLLALGQVSTLRRLVSARERGSLDAALKAERLHFKREALLRAQSQIWTLQSLGRASELLQTAQENTRRHADLAKIIATRALWSLSLAAIRNRR